MLDRFFPAGRVLERLRSSELDVGLDDLAGYLVGRGHSFEVVQEYVRASAHFVRWIRGAGLEMVTVDEGTVRRFLDGHRTGCCCAVQSGKTFSHLGPAAGHLLRFLRERGWPRDAGHDPLVEADLTMKEQALKKVAEPPSRRLRYQAEDRLLAFLDRL